MLEKVQKSATQIYHLCCTEDMMMTFKIMTERARLGKSKLFNLRENSITLLQNRQATRHIDQLFAIES